MCPVTGPVAQDGNWLGCPSSTKNFPGESTLYHRSSSPFVILVLHILIYFSCCKRHHTPRSVFIIHTRSLKNNNLKIAPKCTTVSSSGSRSHSEMRIPAKEVTPGDTDGWAVGQEDGREAAIEGLVTKPAWALETPVDPEAQGCPPRWRGSRHPDLLCGSEKALRQVKNRCCS